MLGDVKNKEKKTAPFLVPYNELLDSEKEYDRGTALEILKLILKTGYSIKKKRTINSGCERDEWKAGFDLAEFLE